eukprot:4149193-Pyramimonas_sp.AAC.1
MPQRYLDVCGELLLQSPLAEPSCATELPRTAAPQRAKQPWFHSWTATSRHMNNVRATLIAPIVLIN